MHHQTGYMSSISTPRRSSLEATGVLRAFATAMLIVCGGASAFGQSTTSLFEQLPPDVKASKTLKLVGDIFPPYRILDKDGSTLMGFDADLARALEPILGVKVEQHTVANLPAVLGGIDSGRYDVTFGPMLATVPRQERYDMITWLMSKPAFMIPLASGRKTSKIEDLCGTRIAVQSGSIAEETIRQLSERCEKKKLGAIEPVKLTDQNVTVVAALAGRADAISMQLTSALYLQTQNPGKFAIQTDETDQLGILYLGISLKKGSPLTPVLLDALKQVWSSGQYAKLMEKWNLSAAKIEGPMLNPAK